MAASSNRLTVEDHATPIDEFIPTDQRRLMHSREAGRTKGRMEGRRKDVRTEGLMGGRKDGWKDGRKNGQTDKRSDGWVGGVRGH